MNALGIIFSELHDKDIPELTKVRTLASVPFAGRYRFIDFMLSNFVNAGIDKVGVITKSNYQSLMDHVGSGKSWDLSRKNGGLIVLPPHGLVGGSLYRTRYDALKGILSFIKSCQEEYVILSDCDNVCNIDLEDVVEQHIAKKADITVVYRDKLLSESTSEKLVFDIDRSGWVTKTYLSTSLTGKHKTYTNILILKRSFLISIIEQSSVLGINSISRDLILKNPAAYRINGYKFDGFYASVDSLPNYYRHSLDLLVKSNRDSLFNQSRPIYTKVRDSAPTAYGLNSNVSNSLIADGCIIEGEVRDSVLFRGVKVKKGAVIENSIIMQGCEIGQDARLNAVIADKNVFIRERKLLAGDRTLPYYISKNTII